jgi:hypothetical protein
MSQWGIAVERFAILGFRSFLANARLQSGVVDSVRIVTIYLTAYNDSTLDASFSARRCTSVSTQSALEERACTLTAPCLLNKIRPKVSKLTATPTVVQTHTCNVRQGSEANAGSTTQFESAPPFQWLDSSGPEIARDRRSRCVSEPINLH